MTDYDPELTKAEQLTRADLEMRQRASAPTLRDLLAAAQEFFPAVTFAELTSLLSAKGDAAPGVQPSGCRPEG